MEKEKEQPTSDFQTRRKFIQHTALATTGLALAPALNLFAANFTESPSIKSRGFAATAADAKLSKWNFERRAVGDNDVLIDIKYSGICHSDIHQMRGHWFPQQYPVVPGHEIAGIVSAVGKNVSKFKVGDKAGVGCMVDSCMECKSCKDGEEQYCENGKMTFTYGAPDKTSPSGLTQGGYADNIVVKEHFVIKIPANLDLKDAAPLLCAGVTTYAPMMRANLKKGDKVGIAGIGGLGHLAIKIAVSQGAEVYAFTTTEAKKADALAYGAKEVIVVKGDQDLAPHFGKLDYMISTIPYDFNVDAYASLVKPHRNFTQVGIPIGGKLSVTAFMMARNRVNINGSLIGGIPETQAIVDYCAEHKIYPTIEVIKADEINDAWDKVVNKEARYRYVIDASTF
ncbi:NAD(P)-dependent alcohol dehydrogenase [Mucilaginibacter rubeus]|uniref:NAD(P)-dependent alcohol dehydrogenase n=1 Tax=Mucilaginibacter rubeus TaxID=2027860 RepID=A0AAE6MLG6_9SPHI|nr:MULTISPECIES: NAD(P)-dependent alcohol dehydrogenase [Mucilaginibacter]QEM07162.1 NAD(P)-dependent alcohol dehydrogenase [Mucilaginibacter rubeus]QEM19616.1 NAD(P)-dependent alcohol dehydrogenase [Mucilaginibacter gossypii]QTE43693.1 NAD(P)-dependent alcohol dehydrogenase [Mucilaginibacter rubeus]QTE50293.1 NAD(P)-dependent alcohol dehydrogenase [Mucilaginibacter rubeus]QTE55380.1 NAD(P)-dependent alcohol dehydrogenase [Mucilaginibacter rubeus]